MKIYKIKNKDNSIFSFSTFCSEIECLVFDSEANALEVLVNTMCEILKLYHKHMSVFDPSSKINYQEIICEIQKCQTVNELNQTLKDLLKEYLKKQIWPRKLPGNELFVSWTGEDPKYIQLIVSWIPEKLTAAQWTITEQEINEMFTDFKSVDDEITQRINSAASPESLRKYT